MTRKNPRWYQAEAAEAVVTAIQTARNTHPIAAIVTGGGKSLIAAQLTEELIARHPTARVLMLCPSQELVTQNAAEAHAFLAPALAAQIGIYCASLNRKERQRKITIATPQSAWRQIRRFGPIDYCIVDEAHGFDLSLKSVKKLVEGLQEVNPHIRFIGLTATPFRQKGVKTVPLSQCGLFTAKVYDLTAGRNYNRLQREGYIAPILAPTVRFPQIDLSDVKTSGEDFDEKQLAEAAMKITDEAVSVALDNLDGRNHIMWFGVNVAHATMIRDTLARKGESVTLIYGDLDKHDRVEGIREFKERETRHIVSVATLTTGFDAPHVDALVLLRATRSQVLFRQIIGRGLRPEPNKTDCLVLDAGGNFARLGAINADREQGDSRSGLWECSAQTMEAPHSKGPQRERSAIRFPAPSPAIDERDLRVVLALTGFDPSAGGCGYLNDPEHMTCRNCRRPRQGFITQTVKPSPRDPASGIGDSYDMHDEDSIILRDDLCVQTKTLPVHHTDVQPFGDSVLSFTFHTDAGEHTLRLDFDRRTADNRFFAQARKFWEVSTGRALSGEAYRVLLQRDLIPHPTEVTFTKFEDGLVFLTECRFVRDGELHTFRYDPAYGT